MTGMQRPGAQKDSRDPGCDATQNGMQGDGMQPPDLYGGGVWTQHVLGNARQINGSKDSEYNLDLTNLTICSHLVMICHLGCFQNLALNWMTTRHFFRKAPS